MSKLKICGRKGFTLIEIMITVMIISILLAIAIPGFTRARDNSRNKACSSNIAKIATAKDIHTIEARKTEGQAVSMDDLYPVYLKTLPECPAGGEYAPMPVGMAVECSYWQHQP